MATQSIIIYSNPLEQQFWESGMIFPLFVFIVSALVLVVVTTALVRIGLRSLNILPFDRSSDGIYNLFNWAAIGLSVVLAGMLAYHFVI